MSDETDKLPTDEERAIRAEFSVGYLVASKDITDPGELEAFWRWGYGWTLQELDRRSKAGNEPVEDWPVWWQELRKKWDRRKATATQVTK